MELGHTNLIRNSLLMQWNMEVQHTSNYSLGMGLQEYTRISHADLYRDLLNFRNKSH